VEHPSLGSCASTVVTIVIAVGTDGAGEIAVDTVEELADEGGNSLITALKACLGGEIFTAATKVLLANGKAVPIASLKPGQKVLATNTKTGKTRAETVSAVLVRRDTDRYDLTIRAHGRTAVIDTTSSHLFWIPDAHRWIKAGALKYGTHLRTSDGSTATVTGGWTPKITTGPMWDLTVPGNNDHDFYVEAGNTPVLVHNAGCGITMSSAMATTHC
jgi:Pretoxin HINT domain